MSQLCCQQYEKSPIVYVEALYLQSFFDSDPFLAIMLLIKHRGWQIAKTSDIQDCQLGWKPVGVFLRIWRLANNEGM